MSSQILFNKKIIILLPSFILGGAERQAVILGHYLQTICHARVLLYSLSQSKGGLEGYCKKFSLPCRVNENRSRSITSKILNTIRYGKARAYGAIINDIYKEEPQILISFVLRANQVAVCIQKYIDVKLTIWNQRDEGFGFSPPQSLIDLASNVSYFFTNSAGGQKFLIEALKVNASKISISPNLLIKERPTISRIEWRKLYYVPLSSFCVVMVANLHNRKDHRTLFHAWKRIIEDQGLKEQPILILAGHLDNQADELVKLANQLGIYSSVRFIGQQLDIQNVYQSCDLCVFSSNSEGMPNGVIEAMLYGLPIVATDIPSIRNSVGDHNRQWLFTSGQADELAKKISHFINNRDEGVALGRANEKFAEDNYDFLNSGRKYAAKLMELYERK